MKIKLILLAAVLTAAGTSGLIAWSERPGNAGDIKREYAEKVMCETYGANWQALMEAAMRNHAPNKTMADTYEAAIGYHQASH